MTVCPVCGEPNPARASFCLNCGSQLPTAAATGRPARKTVTVVFTDLAGSGSLGQRLDPESLAVEVDGRTVVELGPGAVVGEVALLDGGRRTATLRAVTPCRVAAVPGDRIDRAALAELARTRGWPGPDAP